MLRSTVPAHPDANPSLHSIPIGPASAARAASSKSLYRKRARTSCSRHPPRRRRASDTALRLLISSLVNPTVRLDFYQIRKGGRKLSPVAEEFTAFLKNYIVEWARKSRLE